MLDETDRKNRKNRRYLLSRYIYIYRIKRRIKIFGKNQKGIENEFENEIVNEAFSNEINKLGEEYFIIRNITRENRIKINLKRGKH